MSVGEETYTGLGYINDRPSDGINATDGSIAHTLSVVDHHHHRYNRYFGVAASPVAGINEGDLVDSGGSTPYQVIAGANTWGAWLPLLGTDDTTTGEFVSKKYYDPHLLFIWQIQYISGYFLQIAHSATDVTDALTNYQYSVEVFKPQSPAGRQDPVGIKCGRPPTGHKLWARAWAVGAGSPQTIDFFMGLHFYENGA